MVIQLHKVNFGHVLPLFCWFVNLRAWGKVLFFTASFILILRDS